jgi:two-component system, LytTR family, sensor kinase
MVQNCQFFKGNTKNYVLVMVLGTLAITIFSLLVFYNLKFGSSDFWYFALSCAITTFLIWIGSRNISIYCLKRIHIFTYPIRIIVILTFLLMVYSSLIIVAELRFVEKFYHLTIERSVKIADIITSILITLFITTIHTTYYFFINWKENMLKAEKLEKDNLEAQYETLKNQVNPHFLFNSLNGLLSLVEDKPIAVQYIQSLSEFLRYMLQTREKELVLLSDELLLVKQYLFIQENRFAGKLVVKLDIPLEFHQMFIAPLALQMLVENCIKHNVISNEKPLFIRIYVNDNNYLVVENNLQKKEVENSTGMGLENIVKRYKYLTEKSIEIIEERNIFKAAIPLLKVSL